MPDLRGHTWGCVAICALMLGCNGSGRDETGPEGPNGGPEEDASGSDTGEDGGDDGDDHDDEGGADGKFDVGAMSDVYGGEEEGCERVDFLFVIDSSASMASQQDQLIDAFPKFISTIRTDVAAQDYHIMVVDSDGGDGVEQPEYYGCDGWPGWLGTGIRRSKAGRGQDCGFDTADYFMTQDQTDLEGAFACAALVGTAGWGLEFPMSAMESAISPEHLGPGGCNTGFLREDAVLVITVITDDPEGQGDDSLTVGSPQQWHDAVIAAKHGDETAVVVLGLVPAGDPLRGTTERFVELVELFGDQGVLGEVMMDDYGPFFVEAVSKIDETCDSYTPPG